jgi:sugar phosphate isomerase/epimerase
MALPEPSAGSTPDPAGLSINLATVRAQCDLLQAVDLCLAQGITAIAPWRDQVAKVGLAEAARAVLENGLRVTGLCRGGMFPAATPAGRQEAIDDNLLAIEEAVTLGADCLVLVVGGLPEGSKDIAGARAMVADGVAAILEPARKAGMPLAIEPLHPMYAADRACINTIDQALDICDHLDPSREGGIGVAVDAYHVWWDPNLEAALQRAGHRVLAHHICDWLVPTRDLLLDRGMMGDGVIDLAALRRSIEAAGFKGPQEVEIFSSEIWWKRPAEEVIVTCLERWRRHCQP